MKKITNQHGDVIIERINFIPNNCRKIDAKNGFIVEKGEGIHTHIIPDVNNVEIFTDDETIYFNVLKEIEISHEEHGVQVITPGTYKKHIERQFDYENEIERRVLD